MMARMLFVAVAAVVASARRPGGTRLGRHASAAARGPRRASSVVTRPAAPGSDDKKVLAAVAPKSKRLAMLDAKRKSGEGAA